MQQKHVDEQRPDDEQKPHSEQIRENTQAVVEGAQREVAAARIPWYRTIKRSQILLVLYALQVALFAILAWWVHYHPVLPVDVAITREFQENQNPWLRFTMLAVSYIGAVLLLSAGLILVAAVLLWLVRLRLEAAVLVISCASSSLLNGLIKLIVARPRPSAGLVEVLQAASGNSFPSGHVMQYVAFWGFLFSLGIILFEGKHWWRLALLIVPALFVILVGPSRIYLGDHWASDVLGAYLIGGVWLGITLWVYLKLKAKGVLAPKRKVVQNEPA
jgi:membrane-associated phospholipid phosphatase